MALPDIVNQHLAAIPDKRVQRAVRGVVSNLQDQLEDLGVFITGNVWYADSVNGSSGNSGRNETTTAGLADGPKATIEQAEALASSGDLVIVMPGHTEAITANDQIDVAAGVTVVGLGYGNLRPTLTWSGTDATACVALEGAGARWINILHISSDAGDDITGMVRMEGDDQEVAFCEFREGTGQPESAVLISDGVDRFNVHDNVFTSMTNGAAANDAAIEFSSASTGTTGGRIRNNHIHGTYDQAGIWCSDATAAATDLVIEGNTIINTATSLYAIDMGAGTNMTGFCRNNTMSTNAEVTSIRGGGLELADNRYSLDTKQSQSPGQAVGATLLSIAGGITYGGVSDELAVVTSGGPIIIDSITAVAVSATEAQEAVVFDNITTGASGNLYAADQEFVLDVLTAGEALVLAQGAPAHMEAASQVEDQRGLNWLIQASDTIEFVTAGATETEGTATVLITYRSLGGELEVE